MLSYLAMKSQNWNWIKDTKPNTWQCIFKTYELVDFSVFSATGLQTGSPFYKHTGLLFIQGDTFIKGELFNLLSSSSVWSVLMLLHTTAVFALSTETSKSPPPHLQNTHSSSFLKHELASIPQRISPFLILIFWMFNDLKTTHFISVCSNSNSQFQLKSQDHLFCFLQLSESALMSTGPALKRLRALQSRAENKVISRTR